MAPTKVIVEITYADDLRTAQDGGHDVLRILEETQRSFEGVSHVNAYFAADAPVRPAPAEHPHAGELGLQVATERRARRIADNPQA